MNHVEQAVVFDCRGESLVGVLSIPESHGDTAVVIVVGGPQYRAGSHRQFVKLARDLASAGHVALRFDYGGMGDSSGEPAHFENATHDIGAAIDTVVERVPGIRRVVLWGLCDGASAALLYCHDTTDARVTGLCLLNPWVRSEVSLARTHVKAYYLQRLMQPSFWVKLFSGRVGPSAIGGLARSVRTAAAGGRATAGDGASTALTYPQRMSAAWRNPALGLLLLLSEDDYTSKEFVLHVQSDAAWRHALKRDGLEQHELPGADHTLSDPESQRLATELSVKWLGRHASNPAVADIDSDIDSDSVRTARTPATAA